MHRVGVVAGDHEALCHGPAVVLAGKAQAVVDARQHVPEERGAGALLCAGAHLLVVEAGEHVDAVGILGGDHGLRGSEGAL